MRQEFDLDHFSGGYFSGAIEARRKAEDLSAVLYPNAPQPKGEGGPSWFLIVCLCWLSWFVFVWFGLA